VTYSKKDLIPPRLLYKYRPFADVNDSVRKILVQNNWWFGSRRSFDDEKDFIFPGVEHDPRLAGSDLERAKTEMQEVLDNTGVFCLSESPRDPDLWRRYGSDGAGICFELESDHVTEPDFGPFKVRYSDRPKPLGIDLLAWKEEESSLMLTYFKNAYAGNVRLNGAAFGSGSGNKSLLRIATIPWRHAPSRLSFSAGD
jgi:hypothetical protein